MFSLFSMEFPKRLAVSLVTIFVSVLIGLSVIISLPLPGFTQEDGDDETQVQEQTTEPYISEINDLKTPASPAFTLLDIESASVETIKRPEALAISVASLFQDGALPKDFAIEFAPYPMFKDWIEKYLPLDDYFHPKFRSLYRNLSISIATSPLTEYDQTEETETEIGTRIAIGFRTQLLYGKEPDVVKEAERKLPTLTKEAKSTQECLASLEKLKETYDMVKVLQEVFSSEEKGVRKVVELVEKEIKEIEGDLEDTFNELEKIDLESEPLKEAEEKFFEDTEELFKDTKRTLKDQEVRLEEIQDGIEVLQQIILHHLQVEEEELEKKDKQPAGLRLELATGVVADIPDDDFNKIEFSRFGIWTTGAYRLQEIPVDAVLVLRYIRDSDGGEAENIFDFGCSIKCMLDPMVLSTEAVFRLIRSPSYKESTKRITGTFQYRLTNDLYITLTLGNNYDRNGAEGDLISQLGLSYEIGPDPKIDLNSK